jgi:phosphoserine phosphatase
LTLHVTVPGGHDLSLEHLVLDVKGTLSARAEFRRVESGRDKRAYVEALGAQCCVAIGNGRNDRLMLRAAGLGLPFSARRACVRMRSARPT